MALQMTDETGHGKADVAHAFMAVREVFELPQLWQRIDELDGKLAGDVQLALYEATQDLVRTGTLWFLHDGKMIGDLAGTIARHAEGLAALKPAIEDLLPARLKDHIGEVEARARRTWRAGRLWLPMSRGWKRWDLRQPSRRSRQQARHPILRVAARVLRSRGAFPHPRFGRQGGGDRRTRYLRPAGDRPCRQSARWSRKQPSRAMRSAMMAARDRRSGRGWNGFGPRLQRIEATLEAILGRMPLTIAQLSVVAGQLSELAGPGAPSASPSTGRRSGPARSAASESLPSRKPSRQPRS